MSIKYMGDSFYTQFVGRCYKRKNYSPDYRSFEVLDFENKKFKVKECYVSMGVGIVQFSEMAHSFVQTDYFEEIPKREFESACWLVNNGKLIDLTKKC